MAKKGQKKHLKRLNAPKVWKIPRKTERWAVSTSPGPHPREKSVPLSVLLLSGMGLVRNRKEAKKILSHGEIKVDGRVRKDPNFPLGLMDVLSIPKNDKYWRIVFDNKGYIGYREIESEDSDFKFVKVVEKSPFKGNKFQISLHDGKTIVGDHEDVKVSDTLKISLPEHEILDHIPCKEGMFVWIIGGNNVGKTGEIKKITKVESASSDQFLIETDGEEFQCPQEYVFVLGEENLDFLSLEG